MADREQKRRRLNPIGTSSASNGLTSNQQPPRPRPPLTTSPSHPVSSYSTPPFREAARSPKSVLKPLPPTFPTDHTSLASSSSATEDSRSLGTFTSGTGEPHSTGPTRPKLLSSNSGETIPSLVEPGDEIKVDGYRDGE